LPLLGRIGPIGVLYADKLGVEQFAPALAEYATASAPAAHRGSRADVMAS